VPAPRLSVLIPLHQAAGTVERTLRSLGAIRERAAVEVLVVDDGSTDDGPARARAVLAELGLGAGQVLQQANAGSSAARNRALAESRAPWVYFLDADDELAADPLALVDAAEAADPGATAVLAATVAERDGRTVLRHRAARLTTANARARLSASNPVPICALIARRAAIAAPFDAALRYLEDWDFLLRNPGLFARAVRRDDVVLARIHVHASNKSGHYAALGAARERVAAAQLAQASGTVERNNWRLQRAIGRRLQGRGVDRASFLALPADPVLYAKFAAHALLGKRLLAHDPYASR